MAPLAVVLRSAHWLTNSGAVYQATARLNLGNRGKRVRCGEFPARPFGVETCSRAVIAARARLVGWHGDAEGTGHSSSGNAGATNAPAAGRRPTLATWTWATCTVSLRATDAPHRSRRLKLWTASTSAAAA